MNSLSLSLDPISSSSFSLRHLPKSPFPKSTSLPLKLVMKMENNDNNNFSLNDSPELLSRRDLLLSATVAAAAVSPIPFSSSSSSSSSAAGADELKFPIKLEGRVSRVVSRPRKSRSKREKEEEEEVLLIDGIEFDRNLPVKFDVYVNDDCSDGEAGPTAAEFAGSLVNVPHGPRGTMKTCLRLAITELLESVGADDDDSVLVTLVLKSGVGLVSVGNIAIQLLS